MGAIPRFLVQHYSLTMMVYSIDCHVAHTFHNLTSSDCEILQSILDRQGVGYSVVKS